MAIRTLQRFLLRGDRRSGLLPSTGAIVSLLVFAVTPALSQSVMEQAADQLGSREWVEIQTTVDTGETLGEFFHTGDAGPIIAHAENGAWHPGSRQMFYFGLPHYDPPLFAIYNESTNQWREGPFPPLPCGTPEGCAGAGHSYDHLTIDAARGHVYTFFGTHPEIYRYRVSSNSWELATTYPHDNRLPVTSPLVYFPEMDSLIYISQSSVERFNVTTGQWSVLQSNMPLPRMSMIAEYNPVHGVVMFGGGYNAGENPQKRMWKIDSNGNVTQLNDAPFGLRIQVTVVTADPVTGKYLVFRHDDSSFWEYEITAQSWDQIGQASLAPPFIIGTPIDTLGVNMYVDWSTGDRARVFLYRHGEGSSGGGATEPPIAPAGLVILPQ